MLHWRTDATILLTGLVVIVYTAAGGSQAVNVTQKYQLGVIFCGMLAAFVVLLRRMPAGVGFDDALALAGGFHKLNGVDFSVDASRRYTFWSGLLGGFFLALSYFGTDQSQVQRYLSGTSLRESRLGLMFNAVLKIPMQFFILLLGTMVFVFYQFEPPPVFFNQVVWERGLARDPDGRLRTLEQQYGELHAEKRRAVEAWLDARQSGDARPRPRRGSGPWPPTTGARRCGPRRRRPSNRSPPAAKSPDTDYVFITFILDHLPHGLIGLLIAAFFAATLSSKAAELNALASTTTVDFYRLLVERAGRRRALRGRLALVHRAVGGGRGRLRALRQPGGEPDPGGEHRRLDLLRRGARPVPRRLLPAAGAGDRRLLGGDRGAAPGVRALRQPRASATSGTI